MKIIYEQEGNCISVETSIERVPELRVVSQIFQRVLTSCFLHRDVTIVTISPQKHSLGLELPSPQKKVLGRTKLLINEISDCSEDLLRNINESEEFERSLLIMITGRYNTVEKTIEAVVGKKDLNDTRDTIVMREADGNWLLLYNSNLTISDLNKIEEDIGRFYEPGKH